MFLYCGGRKMKRKKILLVAVLTAFLMLMMPSISAVQRSTIQEPKVLGPTKNDNRSEIEQLKQQIIQRAEELEEQDYSFKKMLKNTHFKDSDGPTVGGLDDPGDWIALVIGLISVGMSMYCLKQALESLANGDIRMTLVWLLDTFIWTIDALLYLANAFDIGEG
jgi:hypothetical protein